MPGVSEGDPDPYDTSLPVELPAIVADLDSIRLTLSRVGSELVLSSFVWMVQDGMKLDLPRQLGLFNYLNQDYWPATYGTMRRLADLQNRVFQNFARRHRFHLLILPGSFHSTRTCSPTRSIFGIREPACTPG